MNEELFSALAGVALAGITFALISGYFAFCYTPKGIGALHSQPRDMEFPRAGVVWFDRRSEDWLVKPRLGLPQTRKFDKRSNPLDYQLDYRRAKDWDRSGYAHIQPYEKEY